MTFKAERYTEVVEQNLTPQTAQSLTVRLSEASPIVSSQEEQVIRVGVFRDGTPQSDYNPILLVKMRDGTEREYRLPPTDSTGQSAIRLEPIQAPNGTIIPYRVCLVGFNPDDCVEDAFLIWGNP
jgi:hypothetical protein